MEGVVGYTEMTMDPVTEFRNALDKLVLEHERLQDRLIEIHQDALKIGKDPTIATWDRQLKLLRIRVEAFMEELHNHSVWEEAALYPLVSMYSGKDMGPAAAMEQEHELAIQYIKAYYSSMDGSFLPIEATKAKDIVSFLLQTYLILIDHFRKEEEWIIPIADQILTDIELFYSC